MSQLQLSFPQLTNEQIERIDGAFAYSVYAQTLPFTVFDKTPLYSAIQLLHPAYTPPNRK
jgi:hypothetical protein